jgi:apolipoprotein N-acyltransferase
MGKLWPLWAFLLGVGLALTLPPFPTGILAPLAIAGLLVLFQQKPRFRAGSAAGCGLFAVHLAWLPVSFTQNFGSWGWVPFLPLILLEAVPLGLLAGLLGKRPLALIGAWVLSDWLRSLGEFSFPWGYPGYALVDSPGRMLAALGGVWLCSLVVLGIGYALANKRWVWAAPWALLWILPLPAANSSQTALLVQGNIDPLAKIYRGDDLAVYQALTARALEQKPEAELVIWPETAVGEVPEETLDQLGGRKLIAGLYGQNQNRAVLFAEEQTDEYAKVRLVPFGEFFPARGVLQPVYSFFFNSFGLPELQDVIPGASLNLLAEYGTYI